MAFGPGQGSASSISCWPSRRCRITTCCPAYAAICWRSWVVCRRPGSTSSAPRPLRGTAANESARW